MGVEKQMGTCPSLTPTHTGVELYPQWMDHRKWKFL